jgi:hypothetical protein
MDYLIIAGMLIGMAICLSYVVWWIATDNGLREWPRKRRRYYIR